MCVCVSLVILSTLRTNRNDPPFNYVKKTSRTTGRRRWNSFSKPTINQWVWNHSVLHFWISTAMWSPAKLHVLVCFSTRRWEFIAWMDRTAPWSWNMGTTRQCSRSWRAWDSHRRHSSTSPSGSAQRTSVRPPHVTWRLLKSSDIWCDFMLFLCRVV